MSKRSAKTFWAIVLIVIILAIKLAWISMAVSSDAGDSMISQCYGSKDCEGMCVIRAICDLDDLENDKNLSGICTEDLQWGSCSFIRVENSSIIKSESGEYELMCLDPKSKCDILYNVSFLLRFVSLFASIFLLVFAQLLGSKRIGKKIKQSRKASKLLIWLILVANVLLEGFLMLSVYLLGEKC